MTIDFARNHGWWRELPFVFRGDSVLIRVDLFSANADTDFVTLTYGADKLGLHRAKRKFELVSSIPTIGGFDRVYEQTYQTYQWPGIYHAVINAFPSKQF